MKVLLVEDERKLASLVEKGLAAEGVVVDWTDSGSVALERAMAQSYDALVLDIMVKDRDGLSVLRQLRKAGNAVPALIITARDAPEERIEGLDMGADDYIVKPFFVDELIARLKAVWRRSKGQGLDVIRSGELSLNLKTREARRGERKIDLATREFNLLALLMQSPGRVYTRVQIFERVWEYHFDPETNLVEVYIGRLRRKIDQDESVKLIETVRGLGYRIRKSDA